MSHVLIALGGNLGDVEVAFSRACAMLGSDIFDVRMSPIYKTAAVYDKPGAVVPQTPAPDYLDAVLAAQTFWEPSELLTRMLEVEKALGRIRPAPACSPRPIDLDLLLYDERIIKPVREGDLELPHPRMHLREFVLKPACDVAPDWIHPALNKTLRQLLYELNLNS